MKEFIKMLLAMINAIAIVWFIAAVIAALPWSIRLPTLLFFATFIGYHMMTE